MVSSVASHVHDGYADAKKGRDRSTQKAIRASAKTALNIGASACRMAGVGSVSTAGHVGVASVISSMSLGTMTPAAAATVVAVAGGPATAAALLIVGTGVAVKALHKAGGCAAQRDQ